MFKFEGSFRGEKKIALFKELNPSNMKNLLVLISIFWTINSFSQNPNPDLFQTWYLRYVHSNDLSTPYTVSGIVPSIAPTLTISSNLTFTGTGACNTFNGSYTELSDTSWTSQFGSFSEQGLTCSTPLLDTFEDSYFSFLESQIGWYQITPQGNGLTLIMNNPIFGQALFQNFALQTNEFYSDAIEIAPIPSNSKIYLNFKQIPISKIQIINLLGQKLKNIMNNFEEIDISELSSGSYILKIYTDTGIITKKIIKE